MTTITLSEALEHLQAIFPTVDREVITLILEANRRQIQPTIDSLLAMSNETSPTSTTVSIEPDTTTEKKEELDKVDDLEKNSSPEVEESDLSKNDSTNQLKEDELLARSLQSQLASDRENLDDEKLAKELERIERDEELARKLQRQEESWDDYLQTSISQRQRAHVRTHQHSDSEDSEDSEPLVDQIEAKLSEIGTDIKEGFANLSAKLSEVFKSTPNSNGDAQKTETNGSTTNPEEKVPLLYDRDDEEDSLLSDEENDVNEELSSLVDKRREKRTVLQINTE